MPPRFNRLLLRGLTAVLALCVVGVLCGAFAVWRAASPPRDVETGAVLTLGLELEPVAIRATDGVSLDGWLLRSSPGAPAILMGHDFGQSKVSLVNLARAIHGAGFTVLLFDFRGHGESAGGGSTFGVAEKRDVLGALQALRTILGSDETPVGIYGAGMGAHAAVLAAADRSTLRVLVLDGLYPDASWPLTRRMWGGLEPGAAAERASVGLFSAMYRVSPTVESASVALGSLRHREVLLLAPSSDPELTTAVRSLYEAIPVRRDLERNFEVLPALRGGDRYGADHDRHANAVVEFFRSRLRRE